jgi:hypothetical protein
VSSWLASLPHQIPFRAASAARRIDDKTIEGSFLCTANDRLDAGMMLVEAMAQLAGGLAFHETRGHGFISGIERCELDRALDAGDVVRIIVSMEADFGGIYRFSATASIDGLECARGRFYLASPTTPNAEA